MKYNLNTILLIPENVHCVGGVVNSLGESNLSENILHQKLWVIYVVGWVLWSLYLFYVRYGDIRFEHKCKISSTSHEIQSDHKLMQIQVMKIES